MALIDGIDRRNSSMSVIHRLSSPQALLSRIHRFNKEKT